MYCVGTLSDEPSVFTYFEKSNYLIHTEKTKVITGYFIKYNSFSRRKD